MILTTCFRCKKLIRLSGPNWTADDGGTRCQQGEDYEFHIPSMKFLILEQVWNAMLAADREFRNTATKQEYIKSIVDFVVSPELPGGDGRHHT